MGDLEQLRAVQGVQDGGKVSSVRASQPRFGLIASSRHIKTPRLKKRAQASHRKVREDLLNRHEHASCFSGTGTRPNVSIPGSISGARSPRPAPMPISEARASRKSSGSSIDHPTLPAPVSVWGSGWSLRRNTACRWRCRPEVLAGMNSVDPSGGSRSRSSRCRRGGVLAPGRHPGGPCSSSCGSRERPRRSTPPRRPRPPRCRLRCGEGAGSRPRADSPVSPRPTSATGPRCRPGGNPGPAVPPASGSARRSRGVLLRRCGARGAFPGIGRPVGQLAGSLVLDDERVTAFDDEEVAARFLPASEQGPPCRLAAKRPASRTNSAARESACRIYPARISIWKNGIRRRRPPSSARAVPGRLRVPAGRAQAAVQRAAEGLERTASKFSTCMASSPIASA